jgi:glycerophosphoryl diester phosphodiesterase
MRPDPAPVMISAHRCGAGGDTALENSREALDRALAMGVEFVEFDVQRCRDGALVVFHDEWVAVDGEPVPIEDLTHAELAARTARPLLEYADVLDALALSGARAHVDLKFTSPRALYDDPHRPAYEVSATQQAVERLGLGNLIVTTVDDRAVRAVRDWADELDGTGPELLVGLSLGRNVRGLPWRHQLRVRLSELLPRLRYLESRANLVVVNHFLARVGVARFARRRGLPLLVWTVDTPGSLRYWLRPGRAWLVTSNFPVQALALRASVGRPGRLNRPGRLSRSERTAARPRRR